MRFATPARESVFTKKLKTMTLDKLYQIIEDRKKTMPQGSYVASLLKAGKDRMLKKVGEEAMEVAIAVKNRGRQRIIEETADLLFHILVMLSSFNIPLLDIYTELEKRNKK